MKTGIWIPVGFAITVIGSAAQAQTVPAGSPIARGNSVTMQRTLPPSLNVIQQPYGFLVFDPRSGRWVEAMYGPTAGNVAPTFNPAFNNTQAGVNTGVAPNVAPLAAPLQTQNMAILPRVNTMSFSPGNALARLQNLAAANVPTLGGGVNLLANQLNTNTFPGAFNLPQNSGVVNPLVNNGFADPTTINGQNAVVNGFNTITGTGINSGFNTGFNGSGGFINPAFAGTVITNPQTGLVGNNFGVVSNGQFPNVVNRGVNFGANVNTGFVGGRNLVVPAGAAAPLAVGGFNNFNNGGGTFNGFAAGRGVTVPTGTAAPLGGRRF